jgi:beta-lactamase regulating signal transducer with metallopeptidase domain
MRAGSRRVWWLLAALVFLTPWKIPLPPLTVKAANFLTSTSATAVADETLAVGTAGASTLTVSAPLLTVIWLSGTAVCLGWLAAQTLMVSRRWSRERLCTDSRLLELLENARRAAGVTAPIGLVVTDRVVSPALMGWLRPRILLPAALTVTLTERQLTMVLLHELAHFRKLDIPAGWLLAAVWAAHWFNPFAWLMVSGWRQFREEAADETALAWLGAADGQAYGATLLRILRFENGARAAIPFGSLAIGESMQNLKTRMIMIKNHGKKPGCYGLVAIVSAALAVTALVAPARAESEQDQAVKSMTAWLEKIDNEKYAESWKAASEFFQKNAPEDVWAKQLSSFRPALGKCVKREVHSALTVKELPLPSGGTVKGDFLMVTFHTDFANAKKLAERVTFEKSADDEWRSAGYYIVPR